MLRPKTISSPSRVSQGWWSVKTAHSSTTSGASPPVAIDGQLVGLQPSSSRIRPTMPSTCAAKP